MGLTKAAFTFQRLMDSIFHDLDFVSCYLDNILIASNSEEEHLRHLKIVLDRLQEHQLIEQVSNCAFFLEEIQLLGLRFSAQGRAVGLEKTVAIRQMASSSNVHWLQSWLGMANDYSPFTPKYVHLTSTLTDFLRNHPLASGLWQEAQFGANCVITTTSRGL